MSTPYDLLIAPFAEFGFMRRALVACLALSLGAAPLGVFLILRRMSLVGDTLGHAVLPGAAIGYWLGGLSLPAMGFGGLVAGLGVALAAGVVARTTQLAEDASFAGFYLLSLSIGVLLLSAGNSQIDLLHVLFGNILAIDAPALLLIVAVTSVSTIVLAALYRLLVLECFDPTFARALSAPGGAVHLVFLTLVVVNLVAGFQVLGTLLAVGLMMLPAAAARLLAETLAGMLLVATAIAAGAGIVGLLASYHFGLASGPAIIVAAGAAYLAAIVLGRGGLARRRRRPQHRAR